jgi:hypothetical protein
MDNIEVFIELDKTPPLFQREVQETLSEWESKLLSVKKIKSNPYGNITQIQYKAYIYCKTFEWLDIHEMIVNSDIGETEVTSKKMYIDEIKEFIKFCPELLE